MAQGVSDTLPRSRQQSTAPTSDQSTANRSEKLTSSMALIGGEAGHVVVVLRLCALSWAGSFVGSGAKIRVLVVLPYVVPWGGQSNAWSWDRILWRCEPSSNKVEAWELYFPFYSREFKIAVSVSVGNSRLEADF